MQIGLFCGGINDPRGLEEFAIQAEADGFDCLWLPQMMGLDALVAAAVIGRCTAHVGIGTAVVPTYPRHPVALAQEAISVQAVSGGRFVLGIGVSQAIAIEKMFGIRFESPVQHMTAYLQALTPLLTSGAADVSGDNYSAHIALKVAGGTPCPLLLGALGPRMQRLAGRLADGAVTWMTGVEAVTTGAISAVTAAADGANRPSPRIAVGLPVYVTDDREEGRARAARSFAAYGMVPAYKANFGRQGVGGPAEVAVVGDETFVAERLAALAAAGVSDFIAVEYGPPEIRQRTRAVLTHHRQRIRRPV